MRRQIREWEVLTRPSPLMAHTVRIDWRVGGHEIRFPRVEDNLRMRILTAYRGCLAVPDHGLHSVQRRVHRHRRARRGGRAATGLCSVHGGAWLDTRAARAAWAT